MDEFTPKSLIGECRLSGLLVYTVQPIKIWSEMSCSQKYVNQGRRFASGILTRELCNICSSEIHMPQRSSDWIVHFLTTGLPVSSVGIKCYCKFWCSSGHVYYVIKLLLNHQWVISLCCYECECSAYECNSWSPKSRPANTAWEESRLSLSYATHDPTVK